MIMCHAAPARTSARARRDGDLPSAQRSSGEPIGRPHASSPVTCNERAPGPLYRTIRGYRAAEATVPGQRLHPAHQVHQVHSATLVRVRAGRNRPCHPEGTHVTDATGTRLRTRLMIITALRRRRLPASFVTRCRCGRPPRCARQYRAYDRGPHHKIPGVTPLAVMAVLRANN